MPPRITAISTRDARFKLGEGEGTDAVHSESVYAYAVALLETDTSGLLGSGLAFTLGKGNDLVCQAIECLAKPLVGRDIESVMSEFGKVFRSIADHPSYRWLGPHKGVVHLALAAITNACFDLWSKSRGVPLWKLLLSLSVDEIIAFLDFTYVEDVLPEKEARKMLEDMLPSRAERLSIVENGYPGYDTSFGWLHFSDDVIIQKVDEAVRSGFKALKLKVGSKEKDRDIRRAKLVRSIVGPDIKLMFDVNQVQKCRFESLCTILYFLTSVAMVTFYFTGDV